MALRNALENVATEAKQDAGNASLASILATLSSDPSTETTLVAVLTELQQKLEPADLAALATAAKQDTLKAAVDAVTAKLTSDPATQTTLAAVLTKLTTTAAAPLSTRISDGSSYIGSTAQRLHIDDGGSSVSVDDNGGSLTVDGTVSVSSATPAATTPGNIRKTVTTAGTAVALNGSTLRIRRGVVCALATNTGVVVTGGSTVIAAVGTRNSPYLNAGDTIELGSVDLSATYIDSTVNGEGVTVYYEA